MPKMKFRNRRAVAVENGDLRVTVLEEGGHIAEIFDKRAGVSPLWQPPWPSIEHSAYDAAKHTEYGQGAEAKLLAGIMGHNLCLDFFGGPSKAEAAAGLTVHGEASTVAYEIDERGVELRMAAKFPLAQIKFERSIELQGRTVRVRERVENLVAWDRPVGWTQHVTLGPPFLQKGKTEFRASLTRSKVIEVHLNDDMQMKQGAEFDWPMAPLAKGGEVDLCVMTDAPQSSEFTGHLADPAREHAYFVAFNAGYRLAFGYVWKRAEFPWLGMWQENMSRRTHAPWNGRTLALGMEFGLSPMPESRRAMVDRGRLFGVPAFGWLPALGCLEAEYWALTEEAEKIPESLAWPS